MRRATYRLASTRAPTYLRGDSNGDDWKFSSVLNHRANLRTTRRMQPSAPAAAPLSTAGRQTKTKNSGQERERQQPRIRIAQGSNITQQLGYLRIEGTQQQRNCGGQAKPLGGSGVGAVGEFIRHAVQPRPRSHRRGSGRRRKHGIVGKGHETSCPADVYLRTEDRA